MSMPDDFDALAGEYVLGTLDAGERASVAARRQREPDLDAAIRAWEARLAPLNEKTDLAPPADLFASIEARIAPGPAGAAASADSGAIDLLTRRLARWRRATFTTGAIAAALALVIVNGRLNPPAAAGGDFVAVLQKDAASPAFLVSVNLASRQLTVRPVAADRPSGKSYELWLVNDTFDAPKSLGVLDTASSTRNDRLKAYAPEIVRASLLAVSIEPEGGSPTGKATGPIVYTGKLFEAAP